MSPKLAASAASAAAPASQARESKSPAVTDDDRKLATSDKLTAAETGGWTAKHAPTVLDAMTHAETVARFAELHGAIKPGLRALSLVSKLLGERHVAKTLEAARYGFGALASLATGYEQYRGSPAKREAFKDLDAVIGGSTDFVFGIACPVAALIDGVLNFALPKAAPELKVRAGGFLSGNLQSVIHGAVALAEGVVTGDFVAVKGFAIKAERGELGVFFEGGFALARVMTKAVARLSFSTWLAPSQT
jgi:hypothetical protein